jgi:hypothetical protein
MMHTTFSAANGVNPILSYTPDGVKMYTLVVNFKIFASLFAAVLVSFALALVKLYEMVMSVVGFVLTANPESLLRLFFLLLILVGLIAFFRYRQPNKGSASC